MLIVRRNPERVLELLLPPFDYAARFLHPLTGTLVRLLVEGRRDRERQATPTSDGRREEEAGEAAHAYLEAGEEQGLIERDERRLLQSIVDFGDTLVREVMTPRPDIVAIRADATLDELRALFREQEYSRIPVYKENLDNILGIVFVKDLIQLDGRRPARRMPIAGLVRPAAFVPETKRVPEMLKEFQRKQVQMAIVVDEYGGTAGLVTLEDLLEEIVGEIRDEYDVETEPVVEEGNGSYVFSAKVNIDEVRERLDVEIEADGFETVGGYVLARVGRVPSVGETFELDGLIVEVLEAERRRIHRSVSERPRKRRSRAGRPGDRFRMPHAGLRLPHRPSERGQVDAAQPGRRRKGRDRLGQAADDADADPGGEELRRRTDRLRGHAWHPSAAPPDERADGRCGGRDPARGRCRGARVRRVDAGQGTATSSCRGCSGT